MAKKRNKRIKMHPVTPPLSGELAKEVLGALFAEGAYDKASVRELDTPFGPVRIAEDALIRSIRNKALLVDLSAGAPEDENYDLLTELIRLEKLQVAYPGEPFLLREIAEHYSRLNEKEKSRACVVQNYERHRGYPLIDMDYAALIQDAENRDDIVQEVFGSDALNPHVVYPAIKAFDIEEVDTFYALHALTFASQNSFEKAEQCLRVLERIGSRRFAYVKTTLALKRHPWKRWLGRLVLLLLALLALGLMVGLVWGIVRLVQWVF